MRNSTSIDYKRIFYDLLAKKHPERLPEFQDILNKDSLDELDVLTISEKISATKKAKSENGKYRSYNKSTILKILDYQKTNQLNNSQLAKHFNLSRNTVAKWKKMFFNLTKMNNNPKTNYYAINIRSRTRQKRSQPTNSYRASECLHTLQSTSR